MKTLIQITVISDDNPFASLSDSKRALAYKLAEHHGASIAIGEGRPLKVSHLAWNNKDGTKMNEVIPFELNKMETWMKNVITACISGANLASPFSGPTIV